MKRVIVKNLIKDKIVDPQKAVIRKQKRTWNNKNNKFYKNAKKR